MTVRLGLGAEEREILRNLPAQLLELLEQGSDDPMLRRLSPPAYASADDAELEAEYQRLMGADLVERHRAALETMVATVDEEELDAEQAHAWLVALNELRLVLGTALDVQEDEAAMRFKRRDPRAQQYALYQYLTWLQDNLIDQLEP